MESIEIHKLPELTSHLPIVFTYTDEFVWEQIMLTEKSAKKLSKALMEILVEQQDEVGVERPKDGFLLATNTEVIIQKDIRQFYPISEIVEND